MTKFVLIALLSHWRRKPWQLLVLIAGLSMATALWTGVQAINSEAKASYSNAAQTARYSALPTVQRTDGSKVYLADFARLRRQGWPVTPILQGTLEIGNRSISILGIDPISHPLAQAISGPGFPALQDWLDPEGVVFAASDTVGILRTEAGWPEARVISTLSPGQVVTDISVAARLLGDPTGISGIGLVGDIPENEDGNYLVLDAPRTADVAGMTDSFHLNLTAFGGLSFVVGLFIFYGGVGLAFEQRRAGIRTMRAIGVPLASLIRALAIELFLIAILSGTIGIFLGYWVAALLLPDVSATLRGLYGAGEIEGLALRGSWIAAGLGLALVGAGLSGATSLVRVASLPLLATAMPKTWARKSRRDSVWVGLTGIGIGVVALVFGNLIAGLAGAFVVLGGLLVVAALFLPLALSRVLGTCGFLAARPYPRWFWADTMSQLPGMSLALMALMLALSANIGVGTMVHSFRAAFVGFLDQRLVSDYYLTAASDAQGAKIADWLGPRVEAVLPIWHVKTVIGGRPAEIYGIVENRVYREKWPFLSARPSVWADVHTQGGALISEQTAHRMGIGIGDKIALEPGWETVVSGIYADYGNSGGQVVVGLRNLLDRHPDVPKRRFGILASTEEMDTLRAELISGFGLSQSALTDRETVRQFSLKVFDRTFAVTAALNILTLSVAGFAIFTSLLTLANMRLPQLAPVWAIGMSRSKLALFEFLRAIILAGMTFVYALPVGLGLAWILLKIVNVEAFGWQLPVHFFPSDWMVILGLALCAGAISAVFPALQIARISPARLTQVFAHER